MNFLQRWLFLVVKVYPPKRLIPGDDYQRSVMVSICNNSKNNRSVHLYFLLYFFLHFLCFRAGSTSALKAEKNNSEHQQPAQSLFNFFACLYLL